MAKKTYWEKLRDPRWQRMRLEIMQRAEFRCESCNADDMTLNVHHKIYRKGADPWDYSREELQCLCEGCHESEHGVRAQIAESMAQLDFADLMTLAGYAKALTTGFDNVSIKIIDGEYASGVGAYFGIGYQGVIELMKNDGMLVIDDVVARLGL